MYFERFQKDSAEVPGFVMPESIAVWDFFLAEKQVERVAGALLEIGVYYGKSAIMLAMQARPEEELVLVDPTHFVDQAAITIGKFKSENVRIIKKKSSSHACWALTKDQKHSFRWITLTAIPGPKPLKTTSVWQVSYWLKKGLFASTTSLIRVTRS